MHGHCQQDSPMPEVRWNLWQSCCGASTARVCGGAANWSSAASRTATRRARCGVAICAGTPREWKNRFGRLVLTLHLLFTCRINQKRLLQQPNLCVGCQVLREIAYPTTSPDLQEIRYLHPGLLSY